MVRFWIWLVISANVVGALYGFVFYYGEQMSETPYRLTIFVPDCPLYTLMFALALLTTHYGKKSGLFCYLVFAGALKYGFWTMFVLLKYRQFYFSPADSALYSVLFVAHLGLFLEPVLLLGKIGVRKSFVAVSLAWFLLNDIVDYGLGTHPPLPDGASRFMFPATALMSLAFTLAAFVLIKNSAAGQ